jgi:hypothetical protein
MSNIRDPGAASTDAAALPAGAVVPITAYKAEEVYKSVEDDRLGK